MTNGMPFNEYSKHSSAMECFYDSNLLLCHLHFDGWMDELFSLPDNEENVNAELSLVESDVDR